MTDAVPLHRPVLVDEVVQGLTQSFAPHLGLDCTFGRGGHSAALLKACPQLNLIALDRDPEAIHYGQKNFSTEIKSGRLKLLHTKFSDYLAAKDLDLKFDLILADLGVSSPQFDDSARGFSFRSDGPLDMRMNPQEVLSAAVIVNTWSDEELIRIFRELGEIAKPERVVKAIERDRVTKPFSKTLELAGLIERVEGWKRKGNHPATQYFMALRMEVNHELDELSLALPQMLEQLSPTGRLAIISFHSLEDRLVKNAFRDSRLGRPISSRVVVAQPQEVALNPRARSAKLRIFQRGSEFGPRTKRNKYPQKNLNQEKS